MPNAFTPNIAAKVNEDIISNRGKGKDKLEEYWRTEPHKRFLLKLPFYIKDLWFKDKKWSIRAGWGNQPKLRKINNTFEDNHGDDVAWDQTGFDTPVLRWERLFTSGKQYEIATSPPSGGRSSKFTPWSEKYT